MKENAGKPLSQPTTPSNNSVNPDGAEKGTLVAAATTTAATTNTTPPAIGSMTATNTITQTVTMTSVDANSYNADGVSKPVFTLMDWIKKYRKNASIFSNFSRTQLKLVNTKQKSVSVLEIESLGEALKSDTQITSLNLEGNQIGNEQARALSEILKSNTRIKDLNLRNNQIRSDGAKCLSEMLKINSRLTELDLSHNEIGSEGAKCFSEALKINTRLTELDLSHNEIGNEGAKWLSEALKINSGLAELYLRHNKIENEGTKRLSEALKINSRLTELDLSHNEIKNEGAKRLSEMLPINTSLKTLLIEFNQIDRTGLGVLGLAFIKNTTLIEFDLINYTELAEEGFRGVLLNHLQQNLSHDNSHQKINKYLKRVAEKLATIERNQKAIQKALRNAFSEAAMLYETAPYYAHAEALVHEVHRQTAIVYRRYGDYLSLINLYLEHFILNPDAIVNFELAEAAFLLSDDIYSKAKLNLETDKQQLILSLLSLSQGPNAENLRSKALYRLKKGTGICNQTFAEVAGMPSEGTIIMFTELEALVKEELVREEMEQKRTVPQPQTAYQREEQASGNKSDEQGRESESEDECDQSIEKNQIPAPEKTLLQKIKLGEAKVYVYEQLIMAPEQKAQPIEFMEGTFTIETFRTHFEKAQPILIDFLTRIFSALEKAAKDEFPPVTTTTTTNVTTTTSTSTSTATKIDGEDSERTSMAVTTARENGSIIYRSPLSNPLRQQIGVEKTNDQSITPPSYRINDL